MNIGIGFYGVIATKKFEPVKDVFLYLSLLERGRHSVRIITSGTGELLDRVQTWLAQNYSNSIQVCSADKGSLTTEAYQGLEVYVDSDPEKLSCLVDKVPHRLLFSKLRNSHQIKGIEVVTDWWELYNHIWHEL